MTEPASEMDGSLPVYAARLEKEGQMVPRKYTSSCAIHVSNKSQKGKTEMLTKAFTECLLID